MNTIVLNENPYKTHSFRASWMGREAIQTTIKKGYSKGIRIISMLWLDTNELNIRVVTGSAIDPNSNFQVLEDITLEAVEHECEQEVINCLIEKHF